MSDLKRGLARLVVLLAIFAGTAFALATFVLAIEASELERDLKIEVAGVEKTLTLTEAMAQLNIPSVSFAVIDADRIAVASAYGEAATPETLYQAASLSKFATAPGRSGSWIRRSSRSMRTSTRRSPHGRSPATGSTRTIPSPCAAS